MDRIRYRLRSCVYQYKYLNHVFAASTTKNSKPTGLHRLKDFRVCRSDPNDWLCHPRRCVAWYLRSGGGCVAGEDGTVFFLVRWCFLPQILLSKTNTVYISIRGSPVEPYPNRWFHKNHPGVNRGTLTQFLEEPFPLDTKKSIFYRSCRVIPLMEEILHQSIGRLSHFLQGVSSGAGFLPSTVPLEVYSKKWYPNWR